MFHYQSCVQLIECPICPWKECAFSSCWPFGWIFCRYQYVKLSDTIIQVLYIQIDFVSYFCIIEMIRGMCWHLQLYLLICLFLLLLLWVFAFMHLETQLLGTYIFGIVTVAYWTYSFIIENYPSLFLCWLKPFQELTWCNLKVASICTG